MERCLQIVAFECDAYSQTGANPELAVVCPLIHCVLCQGKSPVYFAEAFSQGKDSFSGAVWDTLSSHKHTSLAHTAPYSYASLPGPWRTGRAHWLC